MTHRPPARPLALALALGVALVATLAGPAAAHQSSTTYAKVRVRPDATVEYSILLSTKDLYEALGLDRDREATDEEIRAGEERLFRYVTERVRIHGADGKPCPATPGEPLTKIVEQADRKVELRFTARCPAPLTRVEVHYALFFDLDARHTGYVQVTHGERTVTRDFDRGVRRFVWELGAAAPASMSSFDFLVSGVEHIYTGYDHVAFVLGLLLVAAIVRRRRDGATDVWEARPLRAGATYVVKIVTAFTVAHSLTLIAAALGWFDLPGRFVESMIAASIVYVAVENVWLGDPKHRFVLTFAFGLVHGLGFASLLRPMLPPEGVVLPLLLFNLGVELGQLTIVAVVFPILAAVARRDPARYRRTVLLPGSALVGLLGVLWLIERVAEVELISRFLG